jgi:hypothetical protein
MLALAQARAIFALGFSLPLDHWSAHGRELPTAPRPRGNAPSPPRRAPLAEHAWEERVLRNLTRSK